MLPLGQYNEFCFVCIKLQGVYTAECIDKIVLCLCRGHTNAGSSDIVSMGGISHIQARTS